MSTPAGQSCANCRYSEPVVLENEAAFTNCRRYPPQLLVVNPGQDEDAMLVTFPQVEGEDWCGEWTAESPKTPPTAPRRGPRYRYDL